MSATPNINDMHQGDLIRDLAERRLRAEHPAVAEFYVENKSRWRAGYDIMDDQFWCMPETVDGDVLSLDNQPPTHPGLMLWPWAEFQAYKRERQKDLEKANV